MSTNLIVNSQQLSQPNLGMFDGNSDIGNPGIAGKLEYNAKDQTYLLTGSGENMWFSTDEFYFVWKRLKGDFLLRANMKFIGESNHAHRKMGLIIRNGLTSESEHINAVIHGDGLTSLQYRNKIGNDTEEKKSEEVMPDILQLERRGNKYIMSTAKYGETFKQIEVNELKLNDVVYVGLFVCSHIHDRAETAQFSNVRIVKPASKDLVQYREYLGSNLETLLPLILDLP